MSPFLRRTALVMFLGFCLAASGQAGAATATAFFTTGTTNGSLVHLNVQPQVPQQAAFYYNYDSVSCASLGASAVTITVQPTDGSVSMSSGSAQVPSGFPCAGDTMQGTNVTYTWNAVSNGPPAMTPSGGYWECGGNPDMYASTPDECMQILAPELNIKPESCATPSWYAPTGEWYGNGSVTCADVCELSAGSPWTQCSMHFFHYPTAPTTCASGVSTASSPYIRATRWGG